LETINTYYKNKGELEKFVAQNSDIFFDCEPDILVQIFSGWCEAEFLQQLTKEVRDLLPQAKIVGTTTGGEIMNGIVSGLETVLSFSVFRHTKVRSLLLSKENQSDYELGTQLGAALGSEKSKVMILFVTGLSINSGQLLKGIEAKCPNLLVAGGNAGDNFVRCQTYVFDKDKITGSGVVGVVLEGEKIKINRYWHLGWQPIGEAMTVTKAAEGRVYTLDNLPAAQIYYQNMGIEDPKHFKKDYIFEHPFIVKRKGIDIARIPMEFYEDGSITFLADLMEGEQVYLSYGHVKTIVEKMKELYREISTQQVEAIFVYSCVARRSFLNEMCQEETALLQEIAPTAGFFTYGEFFHIDNTNLHLNSTLTLITLSEVDVEEQVVREEAPALRVGKYKNPTDLRQEMERASLLLQIASLLNSSTTIEEIANILCVEGAKILNAEGACLHLFESRSQEFNLVANVGLIENSLLSFLSREAFNTNSVLEGKGILSVRLAKNDHFYGVLSLFRSDSNYKLTSNDQALLEEIANLGVVHIQKAILWDDKRRQLEAITDLFNNAQRLAHSLDRNKIAHDVCRTCVESFGSLLAWIGQAEPDKSVTVLGAYPEIEYPYKIRARWDNSPLGSGPTGEAIKRGVKVVSNNMLLDPKLEIWRETINQYGFEAVAALPLISRDQVHGALMVYGKKGFFNEENTHYLQAYAHQAAAALHNAKLFEESQRRSASLQILHEVDLAILNNLDISVFLKTVLEKIVEFLKISAADILVIDRKSGFLRYSAYQGLHKQYYQNFSSYQFLGEKQIEERKNKILNEEGFKYYRRYSFQCKGGDKGLLEIYQKSDSVLNNEWHAFLTMLVVQIAIAIDQAKLWQGLKLSNLEQRAAYDATIEGWARTLDLRDRETEGHSRRVAEKTLELAIKLGIEGEELIHIRRGALLHDIGKIGIPDNILLKPGPLNGEEWEIMKEHPSYAYKMLSHIEYLRPALDIPYAHHERWDGGGYPRGLKGEEIPLAARIFAPVDVYDALLSDRPYRKAWDKEKAIQYISSLRGTHFDPRIVDYFLEIIQKDF
jgi:HD-GYP domain-containing protein (c-di-GMP phosphodiesterase class II)